MRITMNNNNITRIKFYTFFFLACFFLILPSAFPQAPDRSKPPEIGPPPSMKLPPIQRFKLSNGLPIVLVEKHDVPLVHIELLVDAGTALDPADKEGWASIATALMQDGAGTRDALQIADAIDFLGASISTSSGYHSCGVSLHTPLSKLDSAIVLFGDVALSPMFPPAELDRNRKELLNELIQWHDEPRAIASVMFSHAVFGKTHPYGRQSIGTEKSIRSMAIDDVKAFYGKYFTPGNSTMIIVGDVTEKSIRGRLERIFGKWQGKEVKKVEIPKAEQVKGRQIYLVDKPGAPQSEIRIGRVGVARLSEDYYALLVANTILGGSFSSRLNQNLREQHGYTYGANSRFDFRLYPGPFMAGSAVQTVITDSAIIEFMKELNRILEPVSDEELTRARNYITLRYPESFQTIAQIAGKLIELEMYNLPDNYFSNFTKNVLAVTKSDVQRVAKKYIDPENIAIVIVGDRAQIEQKIAALNLGPIIHKTIPEVLGPMPVLEGDK